MLETLQRIYGLPGNSMVFDFPLLMGKSPFSRRESGGMLPKKILKFQSPKMRFSAFWGLNRGQESAFFIQENVAFTQLSVFQSHN